MPPLRRPSQPPRPPALPATGGELPWNTHRCLVDTMTRLQTRCKTTCPPPSARVLNPHRAVSGLRVRSEQVRLLAIVRGTCSARPAASALAGRGALGAGVATVAAARSGARSASPGAAASTSMAVAPSPPASPSALPLRALARPSAARPPQPQLCHAGSRCRPPRCCRARHPVLQSTDTEVLQSLAAELRSIDRSPGHGCQLSTRHARSLVVRAQTETREGAIDGARGWRGAWGARGAGSVRPALQQRTEARMDAAHNLLPGVLRQPACAPAVPQTLTCACLCARSDSRGQGCSRACAPEALAHRPSPTCGGALFHCTAAREPV